MLQESNLNEIYQGSFCQLNKSTPGFWENKQAIQKDVALIDEMSGNRWDFKDQVIFVTNDHQMFLCNLINTIKPVVPLMKNSEVQLFNYITNTWEQIGCDPIIEPYFIDYTPFKKAGKIFLKFNNGSELVNGDCFMHNLKSVVEANKMMNNQEQVQMNNFDSNTIGQEEKVFIDEDSTQSKTQDFESLSNQTNPKKIGKGKKNIEKEYIKCDGKLNVKSREKRKKERTIEEVKNKVDEWRQIYKDGIIDKSGQHVKVNLDIAAQLVGYSRKTLDDYYTVVKRAVDYDFDFIPYKDQGMGFLRKYVKDRQNGIEDPLNTINAEEAYKNVLNIPKPDTLNTELQQNQEQYAQVNLMSFNNNQQCSCCNNNTNPSNTFENFDLNNNQNMEIEENNNENFKNENLDTVFPPKVEFNENNQLENSFDLKLSTQEQNFFQTSFGSNINSYSDNYGQFFLPDTYLNLNQQSNYRNSFEMFE